jgi:hypothetical protein
MDGGGRAGKIINLVNLYIKREADIVTQDFKYWIGNQVGNVGSPTCIEVIHTNNLMTLLKQGLAKM